MNLPDKEILDILNFHGGADIAIYQQWRHLKTAANPKTLKQLEVIKKTLELYEKQSDKLWEYLHEVTNS